MTTPDVTQREKRSQYLDEWYQSEKFIFRVGAILSLFAAALIAVFDQPGDQWTGMAIAGLVSGGITLLTIVRRPRNQRSTLSFLTVKSQNTRVVFAGLGAVLLITQFGMRPLAMILSAILAMIAGWYQWRVYKIKQFDEFFTTSPLGESEE